MKTISAVINARIESTRTPRKLVRPFAGTTLIEIALEKLNKLDFFDHRFLATAEDELKKYAEKYKNIEIFERKPESVVKGPNQIMVAFEHYTRMPTEYIFWINPCSAFLKIETIRKAYDIFMKTNYRSYISVIPTRDWIFTRGGTALTHKDPHAIQNTSHGEVFFKASHSFYIVNRDYFEKTNGILWTLTPNDPYFIEIPIEQAHDVDTDIEFQFSEFLYEMYKKEKKVF